MKNLFSNKGPYSGLYQIDFDLKPGDNVLDVGGGNKPFPRSTHVIDMPGSDNEKQRHFKKLNIGDRKFIEGDASEVLSDFPDDYFDFCYSSHTFEHIENLQKAIDLISAKCKRGFYALPGSDLEFLTTKKHFGHVNLCRQIGNVLHFCQRPSHSVIDELSHLWEEFFHYPPFNKLFEGHGCRGFRFVWEIRHYWEDKIEYKFYPHGEELFPQLKYFEK